MMTSQSDILQALQFSFLSAYDPFNTTGAPRYVITYQFAGATEPADWDSDFGSGPDDTYTGWTPFTAAEKTAVRKQLDHIETFLNVSFVEVTGDPDPDLNVGKVALGAGTGGVGGPGISSSGSTITRYDAFVVFNNGIDLSHPSRENLILHELGHALGLKHPFNGFTLPAAEDNNKFTVMSYSPNPDNGQDSDAMMLYDVFALQDLWGKATYNSGATTYTGPRTDTIDTIYDSGGKDTFKATASHGKVTFDLRDGMFSSFGDIEDVSIAIGTKIENAIGGRRADKITGNALKNTLDGKGGADKVYGLEGADTIKGGRGNDKLYGDNGNDNLRGGAGGDLIRGGKNKDTIRGETGNDTLFGQRGDDLFIFKEGDGKDTIGDFADDSDTLRIVGHGNKSTVMSKAANVGGDVVFTFDNGDRITVENITKADLSDDVIV